MDQRNPDSVCKRLGDLAATAVPGDDRLPDARQWAVIDQRRDHQSSWRRSRRLWPALVLSVVAVVGLTGWLVARRPLGYQVHGCSQVQGGADCRTGAGSIAFSDGSHLELEARAQIHIHPLAFARGAELSLDDGNATLAVVHRAGARWTVLAGPFRIDVTGTRFSVHWSASRQFLDVDVQAGEVHVSGGALTQAAVLRGGQKLRTGVQPRLADKPDVERPADTSGHSKVGASAPLTNDSVRAQPTAQPAAVTPPASVDRPSTTTRPRVAAARRRAEASPGSPAGTAGRTGPDPESGSAATAGDLREAETSRLPGSSPPIAMPSPAPSSLAKPAATSVVLAPDGHLSGGMTGFAWLARGEGTHLSVPISHEEHGPLLPDANGLCASGTVAGLRCVNEKTPQARCNWDRNWGVAIGFNVKPEGQAWGDDAAKAIAMEFHGHSASYRLNAHRKGDPEQKNYCIEDYRSGQMVTASRFKSRCWADEGETLPSFKDVDLFNLQFMSGMEYVAFRYCISGIRIER